MCGTQLYLVDINVKQSTALYLLSPSLFFLPGKGALFSVLIMTSATYASLKKALLLGISVVCASDISPCMHLCPAQQQFCCYPTLYFLSVLRPNSISCLFLNHVLQIFPEFPPMMYLLSFSKLSVRSNKYQYSENFQPVMG